jgi:hypothetical protein
VQVTVWNPAPLQNLTKMPYAAEGSMLSLLWSGIMLCSLGSIMPVNFLQATSAFKKSKSSPEPLLSACC